MDEEITALAQILGHVEDGGLEALRALCHPARLEVAGWLKAGGAPEDCGGAFPLAAAWVALAELAAGQDGGVERFTAGAVSVQMKGGQDAAARRAVLRLQARQVMRPYIRDEGFVFRGVPG